MLKCPSVEMNKLKTNGPGLEIDVMPHRSEEKTFWSVRGDFRSRRKRMKDYDLLDPETEEEFQARMQESADEDRAYEDMLEAQFELERQRKEEYDNAIFDPEVDWENEFNAGEIYAMSGPGEIRFENGD